MTGQREALAEARDWPGHDLWVFAYGSLMWRPGFAYAEQRRATLTGYRRCFCIYSVHHRGSHKRPGLVLGLDRGGSCHGVVYRIEAGAARGVLAYLQAREQINGVYRQAQVVVDVEHGDVEQGGFETSCGLARAGSVAASLRIDAVAFIAEPAHPSYAGRLPIAIQARLIRAAAGLSGPNLDYLASTLCHLADLGIQERELLRVAALAGPALARGNGADRTARVTGLARALAATPVAAPVMPPVQRRRFVYRIG
ncbi:MAG: gamma-glutamylcyclotransferase [Hyphomicrobium aestuarii]|nr:gamma-glutamylcyclotransferase [Hyphomicrobium aestuarii]